MRRVELTKEQYALVDDDDYREVCHRRWYAKPTNRFGNFYATCVDRSTGTKIWLYMHRLLLNCAANQQIDHIDGNGLNNQRANLRIVTQIQNSANARKSKRNTTGYKGVTFRQDLGKWAAQIHSLGKKTHIGLFSDPIDAAKAYDDAARSRWGEYANVNFPFSTSTRRD